MFFFTLYSKSHFDSERNLLKGLNSGKIYCSVKEKETGDYENLVKPLDESVDKRWKCLCTLNFFFPLFRPRPQPQFNLASTG